MSAQQTPVVIDSAAHRKMRARALSSAAAHGFLFDTAMASLADRLKDTAYSFAHALILDGYGGRMQQHLAKNRLLGTKIKKITESDCAENFARTAKHDNTCEAVVADIDSLPFAPHSFDLVLSPFQLHWANDLVGSLIQIRRLLKPDGAFFGVLAVGDSFAQLRRIIAETEIEVCAGASPHILPFAPTPQLGGLMQRAGFALPVVDCDRVDIHYRDPEKIWQDLRGMGEANALSARIRKPLPRKLFTAINRKLMQSTQDGVITVTVELAFLHGWQPSHRQPTPQARGSGEVSLRDVL